MQRIDCDHFAFDGKMLQELPSFGGLVGLILDRLLGQDHAQFMTEGAQQLQNCLARLGTVLQFLAIHGDTCPGL